MKKLLLVGLLLSFQLNYAGSEREIQHHSKACVVGFVIASAGVAIAINAVKELEKNPGNAVQQNLYHFGSAVTFVGAGIVGYSLGSKSSQESRRK